MEAPVHFLHHLNFATTIHISVLSVEQPLKDVKSFPQTTSEH